MIPDDDTSLTSPSAFVNPPIDRKFLDGILIGMIDRKMVRELRRRLGLTTAEAAGRAEMKHRQQWHEIECGHGDVSTKTMDRIANALGVDVAMIQTQQEMRK